MLRCSHCGKEFSEWAARCPYCREPADPVATPTSGAPTVELGGHPGAPVDRSTGTGDRRPPRRYELPDPMPPVVHLESAGAGDELPFQHGRRVPGSQPQRSAAPVFPDRIGTERLQPAPLLPQPPHPQPPRSAPPHSEPPPGRHTHRAAEPGPRSRRKVSPALVIIGLAVIG